MALPFVGSTRSGAKARQQGSESGAVGIGNNHEAEAKAIAALYVANDCVGFDAAFLNEKI